MLSGLLILVSRCCRWRRCIRAAGADVLHAHGYKAAGLCAPGAKIIRAPLVVTWHNAVLGSGGSARAGPGAAATGGPRRRPHTGREQRPGRRGGPARGSVGSAGAGRGPGATRRDGQPRGRTSPAGAVAGRPDGLTVSRLAPQKNLAMLADVAAALRDRADLQFVVVGEGPSGRRSSGGSPTTGHGSRCSVSAMMSPRCCTPPIWRC